MTKPVTQQYNTIIKDRTNAKASASFDGKRLSADGGALLLRVADNVFGLTGWLARCFSDHRDPEHREHELDCLVAQRVMAIALAYENLNDHDQLRVALTSKTRTERPCAGAAIANGASICSYSVLFDALQMNGPERLLEAGLESYISTVLLPRVCSVISTLDKN